MTDKIVKIREIRDDNDGETIVNSLLAEGWTFISACQVGTPDAMDLVYVVGATEEVLSKEPPSTGKVEKLLKTLK